MEVTSQFYDITEDNNILQYKEGKLGLAHLKDLNVIRQIDLDDVTAVHSSSDGDKYWIARGADGKI